MRAVLDAPAPGPRRAVRAAHARGLRGGARDQHRERVLRRGEPRGPERERDHRDGQQRRGAGGVQPIPGTQSVQQSAVEGGRNVCETPCKISAYDTCRRRANACIGFLLLDHRRAAPEVPGRCSLRAAGPDGAVRAYFNTDAAGSQASCGVEGATVCMHHL